MYAYAMNKIEKINFKNKKKKFNLKSLSLFASSFAIIGTVALSMTSAAPVKEDLKSYYPNTNKYGNHYLEGFNHATGNPLRSVFWFEKVDQWSFKAYNSAPENPDARCNWDLLSWWDDGYLRYSQTHHDCPGSTPNDIYYDSPIIFLPRYWKGGSWKLTGESGAKYYENGQLRCTGTNRWTAEIIGWEEVAPKVKGIHWRSTQITTWDSGDVLGKCFAGYVTNWQEDNWLAKIPNPSGNLEKALKRSKGGNLDTKSGNWDVWYDKWVKLPGVN